MNSVAVYLRVSSSKQETDNQRPDIELYCQSQGWEMAEVYSEEASAWKDGHQTELSRLLNDLRSGKRKFSQVVVWSLDRLSRQGPLAVLTLMDSFKRLGCPVVSVKEPWSNTPVSDVLYSLVAWVAMYESQRRSERTLAGLARARAANGGNLPARGKDKGQRRKGGYIARYQNKVRQVVGVGESG